MTKTETTTTMVEDKGTAFVEQWIATMTAVRGMDALLAAIREQQTVQTAREILGGAYVTAETLHDVVGRFDGVTAKSVAQRVRTVAVSIHEAMGREQSRRVADAAWERQHDL